MVDGRDLVDVLRLGAQGVVIGTAFVAAPELFAHDYHRAAYVEAASGDTILTDMFHINWPIGAPVRVLKNSATRGERGDPFGSAQVIGDEEGRPIYLFSTDLPSRVMTGDFEAMMLMNAEQAFRFFGRNLIRNLHDVLDFANWQTPRSLPSCRRTASLRRARPGSGIPFGDFRPSPCLPQAHRAVMRQP